MLLYNHATMRNLIGQTSSILNRTTRLAGSRHAWVAVSSIRTDATQFVEEAGQERRSERISVDGSIALPYPPSVEPGNSSHADLRARPRMPSSSQQPLPPSSSSISDAEQPHRPPSLAAAAPAAAPITAAQLTQLVDLLTTHTNIVVITGAGCSTESNLPDYRGPSGAYSTGFKPMTHQQFAANPQNRARYWARSFRGWHEFAGVQPNAAHEALARLQARGWVKGVLTQNVDRLHHRAGSGDVLELHGTTHRVVCMSCGGTTCRHAFQQQLVALNPAAAEQLGAARGISSAAAWQRALAAGTAADARKVAAGQQAEQVPVRRPDGDVEVADAGSAFVVPPCSSCGGVLKPDVVFFGDAVPKERADRALQLASSCDALLVVGSSLMVWSAFRLAKAAKEAGATLAIVNVGETRADDVADLKVPVLAGEALMKLATHPSLLLPRL